MADVWSYPTALQYHFSFFKRISPRPWYGEWFSDTLKGEGTLMYSVRRLPRALFFLRVCASPLEVTLFATGMFQRSGCPLLRAFYFSDSLLFLWLLDQVPPPTIVDEQLRSKRKPMNAADRKNFIKTFFTGLTLIVLMYAMLTAFRDFRDNFSAEIWESLGYGDSPEYSPQRKFRSASSAWW